MASLKDIAADLGVSHALVSCVLNNRMGTTRVSPKKREAILRRARELEYEPNPSAVALKKGRKGVVGMFIHRVGVQGSELSARFIQAACQALSGVGLNLTLQFFEREDEFIVACNEKLLRKIDALIVAGLAHPRLSQNLLNIESQGLPVAAACHGPLDKDLVNFQVDEAMQCYLPTEHLLQLGCRSIAHFYTSPMRYSGYLKAHSDAGLVPDKSLAIPAEYYTSAEGQRCMAQLLESKSAYDGVVTQSDGQAAGALAYLARKRIPEAKWPRITGVDDSPIASDYSLVPVTSSTAEMETAAQMVVNACARKIAGEPVSGQLIMPRLVVRQSTQLKPTAQSGRYR